MVGYNSSVIMTGSFIHVLRNICHWLRQLLTRVRFFDQHVVLYKKLVDMLGFSSYAHLSSLMLVDISKPSLLPKASGSCELTMLHG